MNNTPNNNQEDLESYSLGNMNPVNMSMNDVPVSPVPPVEAMGNVESLDDINMGVLPSDATSPTVEAPAYDVPTPINEFEAPVFNDIGTVPPIGNIPSAPIPENDGGQKSKKGLKMNKTTFIVVIILSLVIVASVVYVLLHKAQGSKAPFITKEVSIQVGKEVSSDINLYADFLSVNASECSLDTTNITDTTTLNAEYSFTVTCNGMTRTGKAKIVDTEAPVVETKEVTIGVNNELSPKDFISKCDDATSCIYEFKDASKVEEYKKEIGEYKVDIIVKDESDNIIEVTANLKVSEIAAGYYLGCTKKQEEYVEKILIGIEDNVYNKKALKTYIFSFDDEEAYKSVKDASTDTDNITYKGISGAPEFNDEEKTLTISNPITYEELNEEFKATIPLPVGELRHFFKERGYTCLFEK